MADTELLSELLEIERRGWDSLCRSAGADFYGSIMTDDALMVLVHGFVLDRDAVVASLGEAEPWEAYVLSDERAFEAGAGSAILVYTGQAWRDDEEPDFLAIMSSVYVREGADWRLSLYQQTPIAPAP